jgi:hypothetical protein
VNGSDNAVGICIEKLFAHYKVKHKGVGYAATDIVEKAALVRNITTKLIHQIFLVHLKLAEFHLVFRLIKHRNGHILAFVPELA